MEIRHSTRVGHEQVRISTAGTCAAVSSCRTRTPRTSASLRSAPITCPKAQLEPVTAAGNVSCRSSTMSPMLQDIVQSIAVMSASYEPPDTPPTDQSSRTSFLLVNFNVFFVPAICRGFKSPFSKFEFGGRPGAGRPSHVQRGPAVNRRWMPDRAVCQRCLSALWALWCGPRPGTQNRHGD